MSRFKGRNAQLIKEHNAGAVEATESETKAIAMEQEEERQKTKAIWNYLCVHAVFKRQASELDDISETIKTMENQGAFRNAEGIWISLSTYKAKLNEFYIAHRKLAMELTFMLKQLKEAYNVTDELIEEKYQEWIVKPTVK